MIKWLFVSMFIFLFLAILSLPACTSCKRLAYEGFDRDKWQQPDRVIRNLNIHEGDRIADLGAGGGYFSFPLAKAVGSSGKLYAVDVDPDMLEYIRKRAAEMKLAQIETIEASTHQSNIPPGVDLVFISNTFHHIPAPVRYFSKLAKSLKPSGRVVVIEYDRSRTWFAKFFGHQTDAATVRELMSKAGFHLIQSFDFLDKQNFQIFELRGKS